MAFFFQQPNSSGLLDAVDSHSKGADSGGGVFAFASKGGIDAFFTLPSIEAMLGGGKPFQIIVGIDAITNAAALLCLAEKVKAYGGALSAHVFLHEQAPSTFHPKFSWFSKGSALSVITGSGNLTERGLGKQVGGQRSNWEAFSVQAMTGKDALETGNKIQEWLQLQSEAGTLCELSDPRVLDRAIANARLRINSRIENGKPKLKSTKTSNVPNIGVETTQLNDDFEAIDVLIRELPSTRSGQGDVGKVAHNKFFEHHGVDKNILMQFVTLDDVPHTARETWLFFNPASANYRLELPETKREYEYGPNDERMILIAVKLDERSFRYTIVCPNSDNASYTEINSLLPPVQKSGRRLMRELFTTADILSNAWQNAPSNLLPVNLQTADI